ncbi:MAG TPA: FAD-dependent oxidoreductase [Verrucomicrobiae bacterium]|nr:FAD-dependent oxidoreductase [Verrucomicrobiae bacterium]
MKPAPLFRAKGMILWLVLLAGMMCIPTKAAVVVDADICVYGGTSGGVAAAVAAARLGKNVALVCVNNHVGGLTASGLGVTDKGNAASIGGIAAEFYLRVGQAYGTTNPVYYFEPHVAEQTFMQMLAGAGVTLYTNLQLSSVTLSNLTITQIAMADGSVFRAKEFIDATYEGDLMAQSGVTFTWGRESSATYGESLAGVVVNSVAYPCDPYVIPGNAASGLLPLIQTNAPGTAGAGDRRIQNYNFRLCLTQNVTNQIPITAPTNYSEATYELMHRYITAYVAVNGSVPLNRLIDVQTIIPNGKTDINAYADISTDFLGYNYTYPTNTYAGRQPIYQQHKDYISGLLYYLATSTNVPANVQASMQSYGYAKDEFQDNGGWPYNLYIREARRMVSDYVMEQQDSQGTRAAADSISLASYTLDCHPDARLAVNGVTVTEGGIGVSVPYPYPVSYRSIVPKVGECKNLFCTFALSASHVGFASVRMEPVFMMTSHSAGVAAAFAIDDNVAVQSVNYPKLAAQLLADGQLLTWGSVQSVDTNGIVMTVSTTPGVTVGGSWTTGANSGGWPLPNGPYWHDGNTGTKKFVRFNPTITTNGYYDVYIWWVYDPNRASNVPVRVASASATNTVILNQQIPCTNWVKIASSNYFNIGTGGSVTITNGGANGYVIANAVRFMPLGNIAPGSATSLPMVQIVASDAVGGEFGTNSARFSVVSVNGAATTPVTVNYSVGGTAVAGTDYATLPGSVTIPAGTVATNIYVSPLGNNLTTNQVTVTLTLTSSATYALTNLNSATALIMDRPINNWLRANFTTTELGNPLISGDAANPDGDALPNLLEYALGYSPKVSDANPFSTAVTNGAFQMTYPQSKAATDVSVAVQWSPNLLNWYSGTGYVQQINVVDLVTNRVLTVQATTSTMTNGVGFFRLRAAKL